MEVRALISFSPKRSKCDALIIPIDSYGTPIGKGAREICYKLGKEVESTLGYMAPIPVGKAIKISVKNKNPLRDVVFVIVKDPSRDYSPEDARLAYREAILTCRGIGHSKIALFLPGPLPKEKLEETCKGIYKDLRVYGKYFERVYLIGNSPGEKEIIEGAKSYLRPF